MPAAVRNIVLEAGATFSWDLTVTHKATGLPVTNISSGTMQIRNRIGGDLLATATVTVDDPSNGGILIEIAESTVTALDLTDAVYDLFLTLATGAKHKAAKGSVTFDKRITTS